MPTTRTYANDMKARIYKKTKSRAGKGEVSKDGGFTLVELIVAMFVFTAAITLAVGIFISGLQAERRLVAEIAGNSAVASALEIMMREIRTGYDFTVSGASNNKISFSKGDDKTTSYELQDGGILRGTQAITGENVSVEYLKFSSVQKDNNNLVNLCGPWRITIVMGVKPKNADLISQIQATVSSRILPGDLQKNQECRL